MTNLPPVSSWPTKLKELVFIEQEVDHEQTRWLPKNKSLAVLKLATAPLWLPVRYIVGVATSALNIATAGHFSMLFNHGVERKTGLSAVLHSALAILIAPASAAVDALASVAEIALKPENETLKRIERLAAKMRAGAPSATWLPPRQRATVALRGQQTSGTESRDTGSVDSSNTGTGDSTTEGTGNRGGTRGPGPLTALQQLQAKLQTENLREKDREDLRKGAESLLEEFTNAHNDGLEELVALASCVKELEQEFEKACASKKKLDEELASMDGLLSEGHAVLPVSSAPQSSTDTDTIQPLLAQCMLLNFAVKLAESDSRSQELQSKHISTAKELAEQLAGPLYEGLRQKAEELNKDQGPERKQKQAALAHAAKLLRDCLPPHG